jgi:IS5 family transposase
MRQERTVQASLFDLFAEHEIGRELKAMSLWLDEHLDLIGPAAEDLRPGMALRRPGDRVCRPSRSCAAGFSSSIAS